MLLMNSNIPRLEVSLIMSRIDFDDKTKTYESAKKQMRQVLGSHVATTEATSVSFKSEPTFMAEDVQEAYAAHGYNSRGNGARGKGQFRGSSNVLEGVDVLIVFSLVVELTR